MTVPLSPDQQRDVLAAALDVTSAATGNAERSRVASIAVRRLAQLSGAGVTAFFVRAGSNRFELAALAGPRQREARERWHGGLVATRRHLSAQALPALPGHTQTQLWPLRARGYIIGALAIAGHTRGGDVSALGQAFARHIALPLDRYILRQELRAAADAVEGQADLEGILQAILAGVRRVVPADASSVLLREGAYARIIAVDGHPPEAIGHLLPIAGDVALERSLAQGEPLLLDDPNWSEETCAPGAARIRCNIGAPLRVGAELIGVLYLDSWRKGAFDQEDVRRACHFADYAGVAVARARAHSLTISESVALREAALLATHDPGTGDILPRILEGLRRVVACDGASVLLRDGAEAQIAAVHGHPRSVLGHRFTIAGRTVLETTMHLGLPVVLADLSAEPSYEPAPGAIPIRGHLSVPLKARGEILGMLAIDSLRYGAFGLADQARVELFAGYVAAALLNARMHARLRDAAERDAVTGLYNHRAIHDQLDRALAQAERMHGSLAVAMLDLDGFKLYNDTHGHPAGDAALLAVAAALSEACRQGDMVGRYGGDEFLVVLPGLHAAEAVHLGLRLRDAVTSRTLRLSSGERLPLRVSVGVATYPQDGDNRDLLVARADARLYESKQRGEVVAPGAVEHDPVAHGGDAFSVLDGLVTAVDRKDRYTRAHSEQVTRLALLLGAELGLSADTLRSVRLAGLLHDVGKIGVPDRILKKPGRLTPEEIEIMNGHPALGEAIVAGLPDLVEIRTGVRSHHERWDGNGYPDGLCGEAIPLLGRLLAVPDSYSAMTTDRPYRAALSGAAALAEIKRGAGAQFDPAMAMAFVSALRRKRPRSADGDLIRLVQGA